LIDGYLVGRHKDSPFRKLLLKGDLCQCPPVNLEVGIKSGRFLFTPFGGAFCHIFG
jgi:hypothetical protein